MENSKQLLEAAARAAEKGLQHKFESWDKGAQRARNLAGDYSNAYVQSSWDGYRAGYAQAMADAAACAPHQKGDGNG